MRISNRTRRNISFTLTLIGLACTVVRLFDLLKTPDSGNAWFEFLSIAFLTGMCFDNFLIYLRRIRKGIFYGSK